jgi:TolA-binding protein
MAISALQKLFIPPVFASLAVFSAMAVPLSLMGDKIIEIKLEQEPFFYGKVREGAIVYVIAATAISLGAGVSIAGISGWRNSARKSSKTEEQLSSLEKKLQEKEELIRELSLSESRLQISGLNGFLDNEVPFNPTLTSHNPISQPVVAQTLPQAYQSPVSSSPTDAIAHHSSTHKFADYPQKAPNTSKVNNSIVKNTDIQELQKKIEQMMLKMQAMQDNLETQTPIKQAEEKTEKFKVYYETPVVNQTNFQRC